MRSSAVPGFDDVFLSSVYTLSCSEIYNELLRDFLLVIYLLLVKERMLSLVEFPIEINLVEVVGQRFTIHDEIPALLFKGTLPWLEKN